MPFSIVRNDITRMRVDAIVNAARPSLLGGGGVDGAIHKAAGPGLLKECETLGGCRTGEAKATGAYRLPAKYVIHTVGPVWQDGQSREHRLLAGCYRSSLELAGSLGCRSVAFPLISAGAYGFPSDQAIGIAMKTIAEYLMEHEDMTVYLVIFSQTAYHYSRKIFTDIDSYIDDHYAREHESASGRRAELSEQPLRGLLSHRKRASKEETGTREQENRLPYSPAQVFADADALPDEVCISQQDADIPKHSADIPKHSADIPKHSAAVPQQNIAVPKHGAATKKHLWGDRPGSLEEALKYKDESFVEMLFRILERENMKDSACYKAANITKQVYHKIISGTTKPEKDKAIALAIGLKLDLEETQEFLMKAGYVLSDSYISDLIVRYFIERREYDINTINMTLFEYDQKTLGCKYE